MGLKAVATAIMPLPLPTKRTDWGMMRLSSISRLLRVDNLSELDYNAGDTAEVVHMFNLLKTQYGYSRIVASGVSLGANMLARYMGEQGDALPVKQRW